MMDVKKFFASISALVAIVGGLAGCGNDASANDDSANDTMGQKVGDQKTVDSDTVDGDVLDRDALQQSFKDRLMREYPASSEGDQILSEKAECLSERLVGDLSDDQLEELHEITVKTKEELKRDGISPEMEQAMKKATETCKAEFEKRGVK